MSSAALAAEEDKFDPTRLAYAKQAFLSVPKSFTIRRGQVVGEEQFERRLRRAITAYLAGTAT